MPFLLLVFMTVSVSAFADETMDFQGVGDGVKILSVAEELVGKTRIGNGFNSDCSGTVSFIFLKALDFDLRQIAIGGGNNLTLGIYNGLTNRGDVFVDEIPQAGDIIIFDYTYDVNRDRNSWNDICSHIGIVSDVDGDQTITFIHYASGRVKKSKMNLLFPTDNKIGDKEVNSYLRRYDKKKPIESYLAANFFRCFARLGRGDIESLNRHLLARSADNPKGNREPTKDMVEEESDEYDSGFYYPFHAR